MNKKTRGGLYMNKKTRESIDKKIEIINNKIAMNDDKELLDIYNLFHSENSLADRSVLAKYYIENIPELFNSLNKIVNIDIDSIYNSGYRHRTKNMYKFSLRKQDYSDSVINKETMLQRHIYINEKYYEDILGKVIGYEVTIPCENRKSPIDLISVKYICGELTINLIELKTCTLNSVSHSKELVLRAIFEVSNYYAWFNWALKSQKDGLCDYLMELLNIENETKIHQAKINKVIICSKEMLEELNSYKNQPILNEYTFLSIKQIDRTKAIKVGEEGKFFSIEQFNI